MPDPLTRILSALEPCAGKLASAVLRGGNHRKMIALLDPRKFLAGYGTSSGGFYSSEIASAIARVVKTTS